jgi:hypothetical protein
MKSSGRRGSRRVPPEPIAQPSGPPRRGKSGEGAASAMEQLQLMEQLRQQQQRIAGGRMSD